MVGMLQVLTYMFAFYLVLKGVEIFQIGLASSRPDREPLIAVGVAALIACGIAAIVFINMQDKQAESLSSGLSDTRASMESGASSVAPTDAEVDAALSNAEEAARAADEATKAIEAASRDEPKQ